MRRVLSALECAALFAWLVFAWFLASRVPESLSKFMVLSTVAGQAATRQTRGTDESA